MDKIARTRREVKRQTAANWPAWTDEVRFTITDADQAANAAMNTTWDHQDGPAADDPIWDQWAGEAEAQRQLEAGLRMF